MNDQQYTNPVASDGLYRPPTYGELQPKLEQPWYRKPVTAIAAGVGIVALCSGIALGGLANQTPKECEQALGYAEQAIGYSATGMGAAADGATGGLYARMQATDELNQVAADLKRITPLYKSAKAACLK